jgi:hypothetical protein
VDATVLGINDKQETPRGPSRSSVDLFLFQIFQSNKRRTLQVNYRSRVFSTKHEEGNAILKEIHQGICGHHTSSRTIVAN